ncbi:MAG: hypothetical protein K0R00_1222 [Herbinix sp.]|jgi:hypothetical protein|nr:hypothetical protein [Herbinix sp.]
MKKIIIVGLSCFITFNLFGCSSVNLEKEPIIIEDSDAANIKESEELQESDNPSDLSNQEGKAETPSTSPETSEDVSTNDTVNSNTDVQGENVDSTTTKTDDLTTFKGTVTLEGMEEEVNYSTYQSDYGYQMDYDVDRFTVTSENGMDTFMAENLDPELYPYVFINVKKSEYKGEKADLSIGDHNLSVFDEYSKQTLFTNAPKDNVKLGDYDAIHFEVIDGDQWNSLVRHIYLIRFDKIYYVIETNYFLEASEGYGVRIKAMLDTIVFEKE